MLLLRVLHPTVGKFIFPVRIHGSGMRHEQFTTMHFLWS